MCCCAGKVKARRIYRLHFEEGLGLRRKKPKLPRGLVHRGERAVAVREDERAGVDFMSDALASGQKLRVFTVVDQWTDSGSRKCSLPHHDQSLHRTTSRSP